MVYNGIQIWFHDDIEHSTCVRITWCKILPIWIVIINYYILLRIITNMGDPEVTTGLQYPKMVIHDLNDLGEVSHFRKLPYRHDTHVNCIRVMTHLPLLVE